MDTPSLVIVGAPHFFSRTTLRPLGPRVTFTVSACVLSSRSIPRRASSSKAMILVIGGLILRYWFLARHARRPRRTELVRGPSRPAPAQRLVSLTTVVTFIARV